MIGDGLTLGIISLIIGLIGLIIYLYSLFFDRARLKITSVIPGISGSRPVASDVWRHSISSISVTVYNRGKKDAKNCEGVITFKALDALPLYPSEKGEVLTESRKFDILAGEKKHLVAAWGFSGRAIDGNSEIDKSIFFEKAPPVTAIIHFGEKSIKKTISEKEIEKLFRQHEEQTYRHT